MKSSEVVPQPGNFSKTLLLCFCVCAAGACHKPGQRCLVTEYCARGSLDQVLHKSGVCMCLRWFMSASLSSVPE
jgi:hypothetical protein